MISYHQFLKYWNEKTHQKFKSSKTQNLGMKKIHLKIQNKNHLKNLGIFKMSSYHHLLYYSVSTKSVLREILCRQRDFMCRHRKYSRCVSHSKMIRRHCVDTGKLLCTQENSHVSTQKIRAHLLKLILCRPLNSKWETLYRHRKISENCCVDPALF